jgi:hypothetical protein
MLLKYALLNGCWDYRESLFNSFSFINVLEELGYQLKLVQENDNPDVVFICCFGKITYDGPALKVGYISEDMNRFQGIYHKMTQGYFDLFIGCIPPSKSKKFCKHPYYINITNYKEHTKEYIEGINKMVKEKNFSKLKFCTIVASHDMYGNRMPVIKMMEKISKVECPGKLNNNVPSFDDEGLTKIEYISQFIFNICPENSKGHEGYTTEKIRECINAGCIPIYYGNCDDDIDSKIFNQNRIIRYDPNNKKSMEDCYNKVKELYENKDKLKEFYHQSPYVEGADNVFREMFDEYKKKFSKCYAKNLKKKIK